MESEISIGHKNPHGWVWLAALLGLGLFAGIGWIRHGDIHRLLSGVGFFLIAPNNFRHPIRFNQPLWRQIRTVSAKRNHADWMDWLALAGLIFLVASLAAA